MLALLLVAEVLYSIDIMPLFLYLSSEFMNLLKEDKFSKVCVTISFINNWMKKRSGFFYNSMLKQKVDIPWEVFPHLHYMTRTPDRVLCKHSIQHFHSSYCNEHFDFMSF